MSWTNYIYFLGAYLVGMIVGTYYRETIELVRNNVALLAVIGISTSLAVGAAGFFQIPSYGFTQIAESAWYLQKLAFAGLVLLWFDRTMTSVPKWLDVLANYAFALFFIHMFLLIELLVWMNKNELRMDSAAELLFYIGLSFVLVLGGSTLLIYLSKLLLGKNSRYVLGA